MSGHVERSREDAGEPSPRRVHLVAADDLLTMQRYRLWRTYVALCGQVVTDESDLPNACDDDGGGEELHYCPGCVDEATRGQRRVRATNQPIGHASP